MAQKFKLPTKFITPSLSMDVDYTITTVQNADKYASFYPYTFRRRDDHQFVTLKPTDDCLGRSVTINKLFGIPMGMGSVYVRDSDGDWGRKFVDHWWMKSNDGKIYDSQRQYQALYDMRLESGYEYGGYIFNVGEEVMSVDMSKEWIENLNSQPKNFKEIVAKKNKCLEFVYNCLDIADMENVNMIYIHNLAWEDFVDDFYPYSSLGLNLKTKCMIEDISGQIEKRFEMSLVESK
jgi:hypothetical protein